MGFITDEMRNAERQRRQMMAPDPMAVAIEELERQLADCREELAELRRQRDEAGYYYPPPGGWEAELEERVEQAREEGKAEGEAEMRERACRIVRENCAACNGTGYGEPEQHPSGEGWVPTRCEYCGRTIDAIRETVQEESDG